MADRIQGVLDLPLSGEGLRNAKTIARGLKQAGRFEHILTSPLKRSRQVAQEIGKLMKSPVFVVQPLKPWNLGELQGQVSSEAAPDLRQLAMDGDMIPQGGESFNIYKNRLLGYTKMLVEGNGHVCGIVTHSKNISLICDWIKQHPVDLRIDPITLNEVIEDDIEPGEIYWLHRINMGYEIQEDISTAGLVLKPGIWLIAHTETRMNR